MIQKFLIIGSKYEAGIINVSKAYELIRRGKLDVDVPEEFMGLIIGFKGGNINSVTKVLNDMIRERAKKEGENVKNLYKIILHPKSREEINISLDQIEKARKAQKAGIKR